MGLDSTRPGDSDQRAWLERTLASATEPWRIVMLHHPPYSAGYQGSNERHHFVELVVFPDRLVLRAVNQDLRVADETVIAPG